MTLQETDQLIALEAIRQLKARYCRMIDTKQWVELEKLFTPDTKFDGFTSAPEGTDPSTFVTRIAERFESAITIHHVQAPEIKLISSKKARGVWSMMDYVDLQPDAGTSSDPTGRGWVGWGFYEEEYTQDGEVWCISYMRLTRQRMDALSVDHPAAGFTRHRPSTDWL